MKQALLAFLALHPNLTVHGFESPELCATSEGRQRREALLGKTDEIELCAEWLKRHESARTLQVTTRHDSYNWKHAVERDVRTYIPSGAFIAAALAVGLLVRRRPGHQDVFVNLDTKLLDTCRATRLATHAVQPVTV